MTKLWAYNSAAARWETVADSAMAVATAHSSLSGLGPPSDDHPQYLNQTRGDALYAAKVHNHAGVYVTPSGVIAGANITVTNNGDGTVTISAPGGDEVSVGPSAPAGGGLELWVDTDEGAQALMAEGAPMAARGAGPAVATQEWVLEQLGNLGLIPPSEGNET